VCSSSIAPALQVQSSSTKEGGGWVETGGGEDEEEQEEEQDGVKYLKWPSQSYATRK
jgi:hypothetical protein